MFYKGSAKARRGIYMKTVFTNGCFDILHRGHFELLNYAKSLGDVLYVGVDSDEKVKKEMTYE